MQLIHYLMLCFKEVILIKMLTSRITLTSKCGFLNDTWFKLKVSWMKLVRCLLYWICLCVLCILIVTCTHLMAPKKTNTKNQKTPHSLMETVDLCVAVWPRNYLAHRNLGLHQAAEAWNIHTASHILAGWCSTWCKYVFYLEYRGGISPAWCGCTIQRHSSLNEASSMYASM